MKIPKNVFNSLCGKKIKNVEQPGVNVLIFNFSDGTHFTLETELAMSNPVIYGIGYEPTMTKLKK